MTHRFAIACFSLLLIFSYGCESKAPAKMQDDRLLYQRGMEYFERGRYVSALDFFLELKNRFPESPYHIDAKLKLADCYYNTQEYIDAEIEYSQFTSLHPLYKDIATVWLKLGKAQFYQAPKSHQKDLTQIKVAKTTFTKVKRRWPGTTEAKEAQEMIEKCLDQEIEKQLYLARFYFRTKKYDIAVKKLEELSLNTSDNIEYIGTRNVLLARAYIKTEQEEKAKMILQAILNSDTLEAFHADSKKYLQRLM